MARGTWQGSGTWKTTSGGGLVLIIIVLILAGSGAASAAASALVTVLLIAAGVIVLAITGGVGWLVYRARQPRPQLPVTPPLVYQVSPAAAQRLEAPRPLAIEPPREIHIHIHTADPAEAAAIIRTALPGTSRDAITERNE